MKTPPLTKNKLLENTLLQTISSGGYRPHDRFFTVAQLKSKYNVSQATISKALENLEDAGMIYRKHRSGIFISPTSKVQKILIVSPDQRINSSELNRFSFCLGESKAAENANFITINCTQEEFEKSASCLKIIYKTLFGVIFFRCEGLLERYKNMLSNNGIFCMFYGSNTIGGKLSECSRFCYDQHELVFKTLDVLYQKGHRNIACLSMDGNIFQERTRCYIDWMIDKELFVDKNHIFTVPRGKDGYEWMLEKIANKGLTYSAIFCTSNYNLGTGAVQALIKKGIKIPEQVAVIGIGNIQAAKLLRPRLAAMEIDFLGDAQSLIEAFNNGVKAGEPECLGKSKFILEPGESI